MAYLGNSPLNRLYSSQAIALTQGQTAVNVNYTPGLCLVFKNGALLDPGTDYTATNGSVITLTNAAVSGDVLRVLNLAQFSMGAVASEVGVGSIGIATTALAQALVDDATALTPKKLADAFKGGASSLTTNGYQRLPSGLILQYGTGTSDASGLLNVTLPIATPNALLSVAAAPVVNNATSYGINLISASSTVLQFRSSTSNTGVALGTYWIAICM